MTDEPTDASRDGAEPDEDNTAEVIRGILALLDQDEGTTRSSLHALYWQLTLPEVLIAIPSASVVWFAKAYVEALAKRAESETPDLVKRFRSRFRRRTREDRLSVDGGRAATVVVTKDLPDEAKIAFLDLDPTDPELAGKELHWDAAVGAWVPSEALLPAEPGDAANSD